jgi:UDP-glucuronate decarboxylase
MESNYSEGPVNIGTTDEDTVESWARKILSLVSSMREDGDIAPLANGTKQSEVVFMEAVVDDPPRRKPDIQRAKEELGWEPKWTVEEGLRETIRFFASQLEDGH